MEILIFCAVTLYISKSKREEKEINHEYVIEGLQRLA